MFEGESLTAERSAELAAVRNFSPGQLLHVRILFCFWDAQNNVWDAGQSLSYDYCRTFKRELNHGKLCQSSR